MHNLNLATCAGNQFGYVYATCPTLHRLYYGDAQLYLCAAAYSIGALFTTNVADVRCNLSNLLSVIRTPLHEAQYTAATACVPGNGRVRVLVTQKVGLLGHVAVIAHLLGTMCTRWLTSRATKPSWSNALTDKSRKLPREVEHLTQCPHSTQG